MMIDSETTTIHLSKDVEDVGLLNEINAVIYALKIKSVKAFIKEFPNLHQLQGKLQRRNN